MTAPLRSSEYFVAGGTLRPNAPSYVERSADTELLRLIQAGHYCYVLTPRQMGKSSLMTRTALKLREAKVHTVIIDLTEIGSVDIDAWYLGLLTELSRVLRMPIDLKVWWQENADIGQVQRFSSFLRDVVLPYINGSLVIFIDEIDGTLNLDFRDDFFAAIRALYNGRARDEILGKLSFVLLGVASPTELIADPARTPFNIGQRVNLDSFSFDDARVLIEGLENSYPNQGDAIFERIYHWTNGHPYLTQKLCQTIAALSESKIWTNTEIDNLVKTLYWGNKAITEDHLKNVQDRVLLHPKRRDLLSLYHKIYGGAKVQLDDQSPLQNSLRLSGLVTLQDGKLSVHNLIYRKAFDSAWVRAYTTTNRSALIAAVSVFIAAVSVIVTVIALGLTVYDSLVSNQFRNDTNLVLNSNNHPCERIAALGHMSDSRSILSNNNYQEQARETFAIAYLSSSRPLFPELGEYREACSEPWDIIRVVRTGYTIFADVDRDDSSRRHLTDLLAVLAMLDDSASSDELINVRNNLQSEINFWLRGREQYYQGNLEDALTSYNSAISLNSSNSATLYERARVYIALGNYEEATLDCENIVGFARQNVGEQHPLDVTATLTLTISSLPTETSTVIRESQTPVSPANLPDTSPEPVEITPEVLVFVPKFSNSIQIITAVTNLINGNSELLRYVNTSPVTRYPNLAYIGLAGFAANAPDLNPAASPSATQTLDATEIELTMSGEVFAIATEAQGTSNAVLTLTAITNNTPLQFTSTPTASPTPSVPILRTSRQLDARFGPADDYAVILTLGANEELEITGISADGRWYQVILPTGSLAWVPSAVTFVQVFGPREIIGVVAEPVRTVIPNSSPTFISEPAPAICGDDFCEANESETCPADCGS